MTATSVIARPITCTGFRVARTTSLLPRLQMFRSPKALNPQTLLTRSASQLGPRRPQPRYSRFGRAERVYNLWYTNSAFRYGVGAVGLGGGAFYWYNLDRVPITGRRRFNCISPNLEKQISAGGYHQILRQFSGKVLPPGHPYTLMVNRVMERLIPNSGMDGEEWEVRVINDPDQKNAFVMPG